MPFCSSCCLKLECHVWVLGELHRKFNMWHKRGIVIDTGMLDIIVDEWIKRSTEYFPCCFLWTKKSGVPYNDKNKVQRAKDIFEGRKLGRKFY